MKRYMWRMPGTSPADIHDVPRMLDNLALGALARLLFEAIGPAGIPPTMFPSTPLEPDYSGPPQHTTRTRLARALDFR